MSDPVTAYFPSKGENVFNVFDSIILNYTSTLNGSYEGTLQLWSNIVNTTTNALNTPTAYDSVPKDGQFELTDLAAHGNFDHYPIRVWLELDWNGTRNALANSDFTVTSENGVYPTTWAQSSLIVTGSTILRGAASATTTASSSITTGSTSNPTATSTSSSRALSSSSGLSTGAKAGIGIGCAIGGLLILGALIFFFRRRGSSVSKNVTETPELADTPALPVEKDGHLVSSSYGINGKPRFEPRKPVEGSELTELPV